MKHPRKRPSAFNASGSIKPGGEHLVPATCNLRTHGLHVRWLLTGTTGVRRAPIKRPEHDEEGEGEGEGKGWGWGWEGGGPLI